MADDEDATQEAPADGALATSDLGQVTVSAGQLAYSDHTTSMPVVEYRPPRLRTGWIVTLVVAAAIAVAAATFFLGRTTAPQSEAASPTSTVQRTAALPGPPAEPVASESDENEMFDVLDQVPIPYPNRAYVIDHAKRVCEVYAQPHRPSTVDVNRQIQPDTMWDPLEVSNVMMLATMTYCPQFTNHHEAPPTDASDAMRDQLFVQMLHADGVPMTAPNAATAANGRKVCVLSKAAPSFGALTSQVAAMAGLDATTSIYFASSAQTAYCPSGE